MGRTFDLVERTALFGEKIIELAQSLPTSAVMKPLISQIVRSGTSVGANMAEADECDSPKEFRYRISLCRRELRETKHWLRMVVKAEPKCADLARLSWKEADELMRICSTISKKTKPSPK